MLHINGDDQTGAGESDGQSRPEAPGWQFPRTCPSEEDYKQRSAVSEKGRGSSRRAQNSYVVHPDIATEEDSS